MLLKIYYIHVQITGDPCNLIGSHWHDLLIKCIIFWSGNWTFYHASLVWNHACDFKANAAAHSFDSDVTRMISEQILLHPVKLPCSTGIQHFFQCFHQLRDT